MCRSSQIMLSLALSYFGCTTTQAFSSTAFVPRQHTSLFMSSFAADGSEYSSKDADYEDDALTTAKQFTDHDFDEDSDDAAVQELSPVPMSKNSGNRFVAFVWDQDLENQKKGKDERDPLDLHNDRNDLIEDHVMFCRKRNLYNETFNTDSMVDILRSLPM